jgi:hypothetical protein
MQSPSENRAETVKLLFESPSGVTECLVGFVEADETRVVTPLVARVLSGRGAKVTEDGLQQALYLHQWASLHADLFNGARVTYDR